MKKVISSLLIVAFIGTFITPITLAQSSPYMRGVQDGKETARRDVNQLVEGFWGALLGVFAVIHAYMSEPDVRARHYRQLEGKSDDYQRGYIEGYKKIMGKKVMGARLLGWATWVVFLLPATSSGY